MERLSALETLLCAEQAAKKFPLPPGAPKRQVNYFCVGFTKEV